MRSSLSARHFWAASLVLFYLAGCGGGGGGGNSTPPPPQLSIADQYVLEPTATAGSVSYRVGVTLSAASTSAVSVTYATADGSATSGTSDYTPSSGTVAFASGETSKTITIPINPDATSERDETFTVRLSNPVGATIARSTATVTIVDRIALNDTGITTCGNDSSNTVGCPQAYPGQDGEMGRDVTDSSAADGRVGFSFTKLGATGSPLLANASAWSCVRDEVTGLVWEIKLDDAGQLRHRDHTFAWYNPDMATNGGSTGPQTGGSCTGGPNCNTTAYVQAVNAARLCGFNDWRLPSTEELLSIRDYAGVPPAIDTTYFPDIQIATNRLTYWASEPYASGPTSARVVAYSTGAGGSSAADKATFVAHIRLVR